VGHGSFVEVSEREAKIGIEHAGGKFEALLDADLLRTIANGALRRKNDSDCSLNAAVWESLTEHLRSSDRAHHERFRAYKCAIGKVFAERSKYARQKRVQPKLSPSLKRQVVLEKSGQYALTL
jgi:hypothetical protein